MTKCESSCLDNSESEQSSSSNQIDALGQILGGPIVGVIGLALGIPVSLTICAVVLATALPLLIGTIKIDRQEDMATTEVIPAE
jgi:hypothetical protein